VRSLLSAFPAEMLTFYPGTDTSGGANDVLDPQGFINPVKPTSSACIGCHVTASASSHMLANTTTIGESCAVCHASDATFAVDKMHAQY
jgi:hypothetical protein